MSDQRPGYYQDEAGNWLKDRRNPVDRRLTHRDGSWPHHDRRLLLRRKTDREFEERDAQEQIRDALDEFAAHHDPHGHPLPE